MTYSVWVDPPALDAARTLPGNVRQRFRQAIDGLGTDPRPSHSRQLHEPSAPSEIRRLRIDRWRLIYAVSDEHLWVWVLAVRRRPPYRYEDLPALMARLADLRG